MEIVTELVAAGHLYRDVLVTPMPGRPYPGYSLAEARQFLAAADWRRQRARAEAVVDQSLVISAVLAGNVKVIQQHTEDLLATDDDYEDDETE